MLRCPACTLGELCTLQGTRLLGKALLVARDQLRSGLRVSRWPQALPTPGDTASALGAGKAACPPSLQASGTCRVGPGWVPPSPLTVLPRPR